MKAINIQEKFTKFSINWHPHQIAVVDNMQVILAKLKGEFVWHSHEDEDELFQVVKGQLIIHMRDHSVTLNPGEMYVVPRGVEHKPVASEEVWIMLFETKTTEHTGTTQSEQTVAIDDQKWI